MFHLFPWRSIIGVILVLLAWFDPLEFGFEFKAVFFILGFDFMPLFTKIIVLGIDFLLDVSGLGVFLLIQVAEAIILHLLGLGRIIEIIVKPAVVFVLIYFAGLPAWVGLLAAIVDFFLNYQKKIV